MSDLTKLESRPLVARLLDAIAEPAQLTRLADLDLWRGRAGGDARLDPARFVEWLDALLEQDDATTARVLAAMDPALVAAGIAVYVRVLDWAAVSPYRHTDGDIVEPMASLDTERSIELGSFLIVPREATTCETIVGALRALAAEEPAAFAAVMERCRARSSDGFEVDGLDALLDAGGQALHDLAVARDERREREGYATPADACAFLEKARRTGVDAAAPLPPTGPGPLTPSRRLSRLHAFVSAAGGASDAHAEALAFLANTLLAGCHVRDRALTPGEASEAASATCNLGLGRWPARRGTPPDLVAAFELGWSVLHRDVALFAAERLIDVVAGLRADPCAGVADLIALERALTRHWRAGTPWLAREAFDVLAMLDAPAWAALDGLIAECPVLHGAIPASLTSGARSVDPDAFAFIADEAQIALVRRFLEVLPARLCA